MTDWLSPLRVVDIALAWLLVETLIRLARQPRGQSNAGQYGLLANVLAGALLLLALRAVLAGWDTAWFLAFMSAAGATHLLDVWIQSKSGGQRRR